VAFTYNDSLSGDRDKVRLLIGDVTSATAIFNDAELDGILGLDSNVFRAAAIALRARAATFIEKAIQFRVGADAGGQFSVDRRGIIKEFERMILSYEARAQTPSESFDRFDFNVDIFGRDASHYQGKTDPELSWEN
jgi:hypothetical protein